MSDTPRTDAHTRQLIDTLQHPHWIEFARQLERENAELRQDGICRRRGIPTKEESKRIKERDEHIERLWKENAALRADRDRLNWLSSEEGNQWASHYFETMLEIPPMNRHSIDAARKEQK